MDAYHSVRDLARGNRRVSIWDAVESVPTYPLPFPEPIQYNIRTMSGEVGGSNPAASSGAHKHARPQIPGHELLTVIGTGSYGDVWLARSVIGAHRAIKVVYLDNFTDEKPFLREFEGIRSFEPISREHPGLVDILQVGRNEAEGYYYYVMELADDARDGAGRSVGNTRKDDDSDPRPRTPKAIKSESYLPATLRNLLRNDSSVPTTQSESRRALATRTCLEIASELASALQHLHRNGLVHRDIKPSNIIFVNGVAKLADIGLVTPANEDPSFLGTEGFVAPEGTGSPSADIFALGKVLYEMLTGFSARDYPKVPDHWPRAGERAELHELNQVVLHACEGDPDRRYTTATELRSDLDLLISQKSLAIRRLQKRIRILVGALGVVLLVLLVTGFWFYRSRAAEQSRRRELRETEISLAQLRRMGWFDESIRLLKRPASIRVDEEVEGVATGMMAGWDARFLAWVTNNEASSCAFAPDGQAIAAGYADSPSILFDTNGVATKLNLFGEGPVCWPAGSAPLELTVSSNRLILRNATNGLFVKQFGEEEHFHDSSSPVLAISPKGDRAAVVLASRLKVYDTASGDLILDPAVGGKALAFSPDSSLIALGDSGGTIQVFSVLNRSNIATLLYGVPGNAITCMAFTQDRVVPFNEDFSTNSWLLAAGDRGAEIVIWDLRSAQPRAFCHGSTWTVGSLCFSPDGMTLASAGRNEGHLWDAATGQQILLFGGSGSGTSTVLAFDSTGLRLLVGGRKGAGQAHIRLHQLIPDRGMLALTGLCAPIRRVWLSKDSRLVAAVSDDWHLGIWSANLRKLMFTFTFESPTNVFADTAGGCFDLKGQRFAFSAGQKAFLYGLTNGRLLQKWELRPSDSDELQWDDQGRLLFLRQEQIADTDEDTCRLYELGSSATPKLLFQQTNWSVGGIALAPGGRHFFAWNAGSNGTPHVLHAYAVKNGREVWKATARSTDDQRVRVDPSGGLFGYTYSDSTSCLRIIRFSDFSDVAIGFDGADAISPSGHEFAVNGRFVRSTPSGFRVIPIPLDHIAPSPPIFSRDGARLVWGTASGTVFVLDINELDRRLSHLSH